MRVTAGPWGIAGRGFAVVLDVAPGERAEVGATLTRADGALWVLSGVETGRTMPRGAVILRGETAPAVGDDLAAAG